MNVFLVENWEQKARLSGALFGQLFMGLDAVDLDAGIRRPPGEFIPASEDRRRVGIDDHSW